MIRRALVVSTRIPLRASLARVLHSLGYSVELADSQKRALELANDTPLDAAIVVSGSQLTKLPQKLRGRVPRTIVIDETPDVEAQVLEQVPHALALRHGLGDKPGGASAIRRVEQCTLDPRGRIFRDQDGRHVRLTRAEAAVLTTLMDNSRRVLSRDQLRHAAFGRGIDPYDRSIDMLVARLRRKIEQDAKAPRLIVTVPGLGYQFTAQSQNGQDVRARDLPQSQSAPGHPASTIAIAPPEEFTSAQARAERRQLTIVCCGLGQSTRLPHHLDPEDFGALVRRFHELCANVSTQWGARVISSLGSDVIATFGHPQGHEDDAERAVHAALALLEKASGLLSPSEGRLELRIGIATSLVLISRDHSVVGEAILVAPRLSNAAPGNSIIVTESTRKLLGNVFEAETLGPLRLKGIPDPVKACRISGKKPTESLFFARRTENLLRLSGGSVNSIN